MLRWLNNFADNNEVMALAVAVFFIFFGTMLAAKFDSKWGYVVMALAVVFGLYTLKVNSFFGLM